MPVFLAAEGEKALYCFKIQLIKEYAYQRKFDILLVYMFDRIGRIADETPFVVEWLINHGIRVWSAEEGEQRIDNHTDRLLNYIRFWQADGESRKTSLRTANSLHILTEQGFFTGGVCPYGFSFVKSGRMNKRKQEVNDLAICAPEASVIHLMFNLAYYSGYGAQRIANYLYANGYKNRNGDNWHPSTIQGILRNPLYTGILRSGEVYSDPQEHLRIIDDKVFSSVQDMLKKRSRQYERKSFEEKYHSPEAFVQMSRRIMAVPIPDEKVEKQNELKVAAPELKAAKGVKEESL